ncbi:MAG TPA: cation transporter, partial [Chitinophagaceae bacterium]
MAATRNDSIYIPLEGVESEHCALTVDKGLNKIPGITAHRVELNNRRAVIDTQDVIHVLPNAVQSISDLGYDVDSVKKNFSVLGMTCASCASSSQGILENLPGVLRVSVNYANSMAQVEYLPSIATTEKMKAALQSIGYDLVIDETDDAKDQVEQLHQEKYSGLKRKTIGAVLLSIPITIVGMFFERSLYSNYIMWVLATPVVFLFGKQFFINAFKQAKHRSANMDTLVALST